jgi:hypothetical protein
MPDDGTRSFSMVLLGLAVAALVLLVVAIGLAAPFIVMGLAIWLVVRCVSGLRRSSAAPVVVAPSAPQDRTAHDLGWAVGLLVTGAAWLVGARFLASILLGLGAGLLARRLLEMRRAQTV